MSVDITFDEISISVETSVSDDIVDFSIDRLSWFYNVNVILYVSIYLSSFENKSLKIIDLSYLEVDVIYKSYSFVNVLRYPFILIVSLYFPTIPTE